MCNLYSNKVAPAAVIAAFEQLRIPLTFPEGVPNFEPRDEIRITDRAPILRWSAAAGTGEGAAELVQRRWSWPGPGGKPVYNFRSDGREFGNGRCLIVADSFYEFTAPAEPRADKRKDRWSFSYAGRDWFCIAGLWRSGDVGEAFTMLTTEPGADVAPYHHRQVAVIGPEGWRAWLDGSGAARDLLRPCPAGTLSVRKAG
jgi:putative SOS response-associated peptidase YedK